MNKTKLSFAALTIALLPMVVLAVNNPINNVSGAPEVNINGLVNNLLAKIWVVFAGIAVVAFLVAGILFLTAQGNAEKIATARQAFLWGVAGVVVGILSFVIIQIAGSLLQ